MKSAKQNVTIFQTPAIKTTPKKKTVIESVESDDFIDGRQSDCFVARKKKQQTKTNTFPTIARKRDAERRKRT